MDNKGSETRHAAMPVLLDITKCPMEVILTVLADQSRNASWAQACIDASENNRELSTTERSELVKKAMPVSHQWLLDRVNDTGELNAFMHDGAHQTIDACNRTRQQGSEACKVLMMAQQQWLLLGWAIASAFLENQSLERSVV